MGNSFRATSLPRVLFVAAISTVLFIAQAHAAQAAHLRVLHTFCQKLNCGDGEYPEGALVRDGSGNLYGVTIGGGAHDAGVIFGLFPHPGTHPRYEYRALYHFCAVSNCVDGVNPNAPLIIGSDGSLYGTTKDNSSSGNDGGLVFRLSPAPDRRKWIYTILYTFCAAKSSCSDGKNPSGGLTYAGAQDGLPYDGGSSLYGFTLGGGRHFGGVAYSLKPGRRQWIDHVLYAFCAVGEEQCTDGWEPYSTPVIDANGVIYGLTDNNGAYSGYAIKLSPGTGRRWEETVLYKFCGSQSCVAPIPSSLTMGPSGDLFGTRQLGGGTNAVGVVFDLAPNRTYTELHKFCVDGDCSKGGGQPNALVLDSAGNIYGTTGIGGRGGYGTIFQISGKHFKTIYNFCARNCQSIRSPNGLAIDAAGNLFGNSIFEDGTTYELTP